MSRNPNWTREEHILAFNLYCQIPFGTIHMRNPRLREFAKLIGRSVGSVSWKLANFARFDPALRARGIRGAEHGASGEAQVWAEFSQDPEALAYESQKLMAERLRTSLVDYAEVEINDLPTSGTEREAMVQLRVKQNFFRRRVLSAYNFRCCVTGLAVPQLLVASHIVPWAEDSAVRLNPKNGLCLNALHDRAFDRGLMWIEDDFTIRISPSFLNASMGELVDAKWIASFDRAPLRLPEKFAPDLELIRRHSAKSRARGGILDDRGQSARSGGLPEF